MVGGVEFQQIVPGGSNTFQRLEKSRETGSQEQHTVLPHGKYRAGQDQHTAEISRNNLRTTASDGRAVSKIHLLPPRPKSISTPRWAMRDAFGKRGEMGTETIATCMMPVSYALELQRYP